MSDPTANYQAISYTNCNANGIEEITIEHRRNIVQWIFKRPGTRRLYYRSPSTGRWCHRCSEVDACLGIELDSIARSFGHRP